MGKLADDMARLRGNMDSMKKNCEQLKENRDALLQNLAKRTDESRRTVSEMLAKFRESFTTMDRNSKSKRLCFVQKTETFVRDLQREVSDMLDMLQKTRMEEGKEQTEKFMELLGSLQKNANELQQMNTQQLVEFAVELANAQSFWFGSENIHQI